MAADPIQQFIQNYMGFKQFESMQQAQLEQQRQFDEQQVLAQRQMENSEIQNYATLLSKVQNPQEAAAIGEFFAQRNPQMADTFATLTQGIVPSMETQTASAAARAGPTAMDAALAVSQGRELSAGQREQGRQFGMTFGENQRQFGIEAEMRRQGIGLQARGLDLQEAEIIQRGELGYTNAMVQGGQLPNMLRGQLSQRRAELQQQMGTMTPEARAAAQREIEDINNQIKRFDNLIAAEATRGRGGAGGGMELKDMYGGLQSAADDFREAKTPAEKQAAAERYNFIARQLGFAPIGFEVRNFMPDRATIGGF